MTILENRNAPYSVHRTHTGTPSNARNHHYLLNFAVSLAAIIFGIAVIAVFALAVRWRKRSSQSYLLEPRIDARIPQSNISVVSDGRSTISLKFPPPGLSPPENPRDRLPSLLRTPPHAHHPAPQARAFRLCQSCISGPSNRPPCYCPTCPNGPGWDNPPAYRANPPSPGAIPSPRLSTTLVGHEDAGPPRPSSITDENAIRRNSQRTPPTLVASRNAHVRSVQDSPTPAGHARRGSAASSADEPESDTSSYSSANSSPTPSTPPAPPEAGSPRLGLSVDVNGPPSLQLSDVPGAPAPAHGWGTIAIAPSRGSLDFAVSYSLSDEISAYILVTPPSQDHLDAPPDETTAPDFILYPSGPSSSPAAVEDRDPGTDGSHARRWFMDLDWFGRRDSPADYSEHVPATGRRSG